jgi:nucleoid-associated protein YgaU
MAITRYRSLNIVEGKYSFKLDPQTRKKLRVTNYDVPFFDNLSEQSFENLDIVEFTFAKTDTLMGLSQKFYGDPSYWWVIALINNVGCEADIENGQQMVVLQPLDVVINELGL